MINLIKKMLYFFSEEAYYDRYQKDMYDFLSQATDIIHLEHLEREWERKYQNAVWR